MWWAGHTPSLSPLSECFPLMAGRHVKDITDDWPSDWTRRQATFVSIGEGASQDVEKEAKSEDVGEYRSGKHCLR